MLKPEERYILHLLRISFGEKDDWDDQQDINENVLMNMIRRNDILATVYSVLPADIRERNEIHYIHILTHSAKQNYEGEKILKTLGENGFDCIALKGWEMRKLYPTKQMRHMADIDILVRPFKFGTIEDLMKGIGYLSQGHSSWKHDNFVKGSIIVEMHKRLTDGNDPIIEWERDLWTRAVSTGHDHIMMMSTEDYYLYHFLHLYKDFLNGSLGLRRVVDTWLLQRPSISDNDFVVECLNKFHIWNFHQRMIEFAKAVFGEREFSSDDVTLLQHALKYGIYGTDKSYNAGRIAGMSENSLLKGKIHSAVAAIFLPFSRMKVQFPLLQKCPILLPFCWFIRIWNLSHRGDVRRRFERLVYSDISSDDFAEAKAFFMAGGIEN